MTERSSSGNSPWELAMEASHAVLEREDCEVLISGERTSYIIPKKDSYRRLLVETVKNDVVVVKEPEEIPEPIVKVSFYTDPKDRDIAGKALGGQFAGRLSQVVSGLEWIDFTLPGSARAARWRNWAESWGFCRGRWQPSGTMKMIAPCWSTWGIPT